MEQQLPPNRIALYATLQTLTLAGCWIWFAVLWSVALFSYTWSDIEWWVLVVAASAGIYGLRPNLERAIDAAWLHGVKTSAALAARAAQLRPIKRRIDLLFSIAMVILLIVGAILWVIFAGATGGA